MGVQRLPVGPLAPSVENAANNAIGGDAAGALPGSEPGTPMPPQDSGLSTPSPILPAETPRHPIKNHPGATVDGGSVLANPGQGEQTDIDGAFSTGIQPGGRQGEGLGTSDSGPVLWTPTPSSRG